MAKTRIRCTDCGCYFRPDEVVLNGRDQYTCNPCFDAELCQEELDERDGRLEAEFAMHGNPESEKN